MTRPLVRELAITGGLGPRPLISELVISGESTGQLRPALSSLQISGVSGDRCPRLSRLSISGDGVQLRPRLSRLVLDGTRNDARPVLRDLKLVGFPIIELVADAGPDVVVFSGQEVTIDGRRSSGEGLSYAWVISGVELRVPFITFIAPPVDEITDMVLELVVTDERGSTAADTMAVTVLP